MTHELAIDGVLDLHTFRPRDVTSVVDEYVRVAANRGLTEVRLIHGRGTGVQRAAVQAILERHPCVASYHDAPESHRGATIAQLVPTPSPDRVS